MGLLDEIVDYSKTYDLGQTKQYKNEWEKSILEFRKIAKKLKKINPLKKKFYNIIKTESGKI